MASSMSGRNWLPERAQRASATPRPREHPCSTAWKGGGVGPAGGDGGSAGRGAVGGCAGGARKDTGGANAHEDPGILHHEAPPSTCLRARSRGGNERRYSNGQTGHDQPDAIPSPGFRSPIRSKDLGRGQDEPKAGDGRVGRRGYSGSEPGSGPDRTKRGVAEFLQPGRGRRARPGDGRSVHRGRGRWHRRLLQSRRPLAAPSNGARPGGVHRRLDLDPADPPRGRERPEQGVEDPAFSARFLRPRGPLRSRRQEPARPPLLPALGRPDRKGRGHGPGHGQPQPDPARPDGDGRLHR